MSVVSWGLARRRHATAVGPGWRRAPRALQGEGEERALPYAVTATLDGRVFEHLILGASLRPGGAFESR